jgi:hypothetical protein
MKVNLEAKGFFLGYAGLVAIAATSLSTVALAVALFMKSREPRPVVLVPGLDAPRVVDPGRVPDVLARDFALDFAIAFENYSPATIERVVKFLRTRVAPELFGQFSHVLEKRARLVAETGMVSQLLPSDPAEARVVRDAERLEVVFPAIRRVYIGDRLSQEAKLSYRLVVTPGQPTRENPTGLYILGQSARVEVPAKEGDGGRQK